MNLKSINSSNAALCHELTTLEILTCVYFSLILFQPLLYNECGDILAFKSNSTHSVLLFTNFTHIYTVKCNHI